MSKVHDCITPALKAFITEQRLFFVGSAPLSADGHVNLSPKGYDSFRILSDRQVAYLDLTGSGNETSAHLAENGRITIMFCAFDGAPNILRLFGRGTVVLPGDAGWGALREHFSALPAMRQIVLVDVSRVQTSCGYGVPLMSVVGERDIMAKWALAKGPDGVAAYRREKNMTSIDGLATHMGRGLGGQDRESPEHE
jgi:hypothetical protein